VIDRLIPLPDSLKDMLASYGFEGLTEYNGKLVMAIQKSWYISNKTAISRLVFSI